MIQTMPLKENHPIPMNPFEPCLHLKNLRHHFVQGGEVIEVLKDINLTLYPSEMMALVGPSGSGKSTLLHMVGLLNKPMGGSIVIKGKACEKLSDKERTDLRSHHIGFVYQAHHLLPEFSALENVMIPQFIWGKKKKEAKERACMLLDMLHLGHRLHHRPGALSGGEQQRVAIARALANKPALLIADEPTGNLDPVNGAHVFQNLQELVTQEHVSVLMATHNMDLAKHMTRCVTLHEGQLLEEKPLV